MGAAWRGPKDGDLDRVLAMVREVKALGLQTCVTLGMLKPGQAERLKDAGLDYYNHNVDTDADFYGQSSPPTSTAIASTPWTRCGRPDSRSVPAASSAWAVAPQPGRDAGPVGQSAPAAGIGADQQPGAHPGTPMARQSRLDPFGSCVPSPPPAS